MSDGCAHEQNLKWTHSDSICSRAELAVSLQSILVSQMWEISCFSPTKYICGKAAFSCHDWFIGDYALHFTLRDAEDSHKSMSVHRNWTQMNVFPLKKKCHFAFCRLSWLWSDNVCVWRHRRRRDFFCLARQLSRAQDALQRFTLQEKPPVLSKRTLPVPRLDSDFCCKSGSCCVHKNPDDTTISARVKLPSHRPHSNNHVWWKVYLNVCKCTF